MALTVPLQAAPQSTLVHLKAVRIEGATVFSAAQLYPLVSHLTNGPVTALDLEAARVALTLKYVSSNYVNSGALLDLGSLSNGIVVYRIVEGRLTGVRIKGSHYIRESVYRSRLEVFSEKPLRVSDLREELQLWQSIYPINRVNGEVRPGTKPGEGLLEVRVDEAFPYHAGLQYANDRPPSTGAEQVTLLLRTESLTRNADTLSVSLGLVRGSTPGMQGASAPGLDDLGLSYAVPIPGHDAVFSATYGRSSASIVEARFEALGVESASETYGVSLTHFLHRTAQSEWSVSLGMDHRFSKTWVLGLPYSLSPGAVNGESEQTVLRLSTDWMKRSANAALSLRLSMNMGIDAFGATQHRDEPDGRFVSWMAQAKYVRRLWNPDFEAVLRGFAQYTPTALLSLEQIAIGGSGSVRGYRENALVRDTGIAGIMELHWIALRSREGRPLVRLVPFVSAGAGWMVEGGATGPQSIESAGMGMVIHPFKQIEASLFWGHAFRSLEFAERDLQDDGIQFRISTWAF